MNSIIIINAGMFDFRLNWKLYSYLPTVMILISKDLFCLNLKTFFNGCPNWSSWSGRYALWLMRILDWIQASFLTIPCPSIEARGKPTLGSNLHSKRNSLCSALTDTCDVFSTYTYNWTFLDNFQHQMYLNLKPIENSS